MTNKIIAGLVSLIVLTVLVLSFFFETLHNLVEGFLIVTIAGLLYVMVYRLVLGVLNVEED